MNARVTAGVVALVAVVGLATLGTWRWAWASGPDVNPRLFGGAETTGAGAVVTIDSVTLPVGSTGSVEVRALNLPEPGLGYWTIDVSFDPSIVSIVACRESMANSVCNPAFPEDRVRFTGAAAVGFIGEVGLGVIDLRCIEVGSSPLTIMAAVFADATTGDPHPMDYTTEEGKVSCTAAVPSPTRTRTATSTPSPTRTRTPTLAQLTGDVDCNRRVDSIDAALILQYVAGLLQRLPC